MDNRRVLRARESSQATDQNAASSRQSPGRPRRIGKAVGALTPLGLLDFVARRTTRCARLGRAPLKQVRRVSSRSAARGHEIKQTQAPRNDAPRPARTRLCRDVIGARRRAHQVSSGGGTRRGRILWRAAMLGLGSGALARFTARRSCLSGAPFGARSEFYDADPRPSIAAESERSADRHSMSPCGYRLPRPRKS